MKATSQTTFPDFREHRRQVPLPEAPVEKSRENALYDGRKLWASVLVHCLVPMPRVVLSPSVCMEEPHGETQKVKTVP